MIALLSLFDFGYFTMAYGTMSWSFASLKIFLQMINVCMLRDFNTTLWHRKDWSFLVNSIWCLVTEDKQNFH